MISWRGFFFTYAADPHIMVIPALSASCFQKLSGCVNNGRLCVCHLVSPVDLGQGGFCVLVRTRGGGCFQAGVCWFSVSCGHHPTPHASLPHRTSAPFRPEISKLCSVVSFGIDEWSIIVGICDSACGLCRGIMEF